jgi:mono/diheme cytochrome c family protein
MKRIGMFVAALMLLQVSAVRLQAAEMSEKEKALASPYPNDFGPGELPADVLKSYPANVQEGYKLLLAKCAQCHQANRPLNSRFVEPS